MYPNYANYHGKFEFFHFHLSSRREQLKRSVSVSKVGLFIYFLTYFVCGKGQDFTIVRAIYLLMFTVYCLLQQELILDYLDRLNSGLCSVSSMFSDTPESLYSKKKVSLSCNKVIVILSLCSN